MEPMLLKPVGKDYLWGGNRLKEEYYKDLQETPLAETWECSVHPNGPSTIVNGTHKGMKLDVVLKEHPEYLGDRVGNELPILIKLIDAEKDLSVQVHPDDKYAKTYENQNGKTEMWYVLDAKPGVSLIHGFLHDVTADQLKASKQGDAYDYYAHWSREINVHYVTLIGGYGEHYYDDDKEEWVYEAVEFDRNAPAGGEYEIENGWWPNFNDDDRHEFVGYSTDAEAEEATYEPGDRVVFPIDSNDITLYAIWKVRPVIRYDGKGGTWDRDGKTVGVWDQVYDNGRVAYVGTGAPEHTDVINEGTDDEYEVRYEFRHWIDKDGKVCDDKLLRLEYGDEYTFYATYAKVINISYDCNGGAFYYNEPFVEENENYEEWRGETDGKVHFREECDDNEWWVDGQTPDYVVYDEDGDVIIKRYRYGEWVQLRNDPELMFDVNNDGCKFVGWLVDGVPNDWGFHVTDHTYVTAEWENEYELILDYNGGERFLETENSGNFYSEGETVRLEGFYEPYRSGYEFAGWRDPDGRLVSRVVMESDITLVAEWVEIPMDADDFYAHCGTELVLYAGTGFYGYMVYPGEERELTFVSGNSNIAKGFNGTFTKGFRIEALSSGVTTVQVSDGTHTWDIEVTVIEPLLYIDKSTDVGTMNYKAEYDRWLKNTEGDVLEELKGMNEASIEDAL